MSSIIASGRDALSGIRERFAGVNLRQNGIFLALIGLVIFFAITTPDAVSLAPGNFSNLVVQNGYILVLAIGMVMVIIAGHIDLSVGSIAAFIGGVAGILVVRPLEQDGWEWLPALPWWAGIIGAILVGCLVGVWQGFWIAYVGIPAFIVTLAGMLLFRGMALLTLQNTNVGPFPDEFRAIGNGFLDKEQSLNALVGMSPTYNFTALVVTGGSLFAMWFVSLRQRAGKIKYGQAVEPRGWFYVKSIILSMMLAYVGFQLSQANGIPITLILLVVLVIGYTIVMTRTPFGRYIYAIGGNLNAAVLSGINVRKVNFLIFVNMGALAALSGVLIAARMNSAVPKAGEGFELDAISSVFIGGAAVSGGVGTVTGSMLGGMIQGVLANGMNLNSVGIDIQMTIKGLVLLLAVAFDVWSKRSK